MSTPSADETLRERLKSSLWFTIGKIVDEECLALNVNATPQFIGALTEMVWAQMENVSRDLEAFSGHAGRSTITTDDVLLLTRRNEGLEDLLKEFVEKEAEGKAKEKGEMRRKAKGERRRKAKGERERKAKGKGKERAGK